MNCTKIFIGGLHRKGTTEKWSRTSGVIWSAVTRFLSAHPPNYLSTTTEEKENSECAWSVSSNFHSYRSEDKFCCEFISQLGKAYKRFPQFSLKFAQERSQRQPLESSANSFWIYHIPSISRLQGLRDIRPKFYGTAAMKVQRNPCFSKIEPGDVLHFQNILGEKSVIQDKDELDAANVDWMGKYKGASQLLLCPRNTEEVSKVLKYCNSRHLAVVPQGGNTGLVGGSVPVFDEVIINLSLMNNTISFDKVSGILVCEAGCILENLDNYLADQGYTMPLDLGAKGSCQIGGNVSTNAGGLRLMRYGSLRGNVLGLEVVLANGTIVDILGTLRKDNTGYDLKQLFMGSEGTLGIVTKVSILAAPRLSSINLAFLACGDFLNCQRLLFEAKRQLGEIISAFEFLDHSSLDLVLNHLEGVRNPLPSSKEKFYILIETTGSNQSHDKAKLDAFLESCIENGLIVDGSVAQDYNQTAAFWRIREGITEALTRAGAVYKYDLSLPIQHLYEIVDEMQARLGESAKVLGYGHLGDGNLHLNISAPKHDEKLLEQIEPFVYEWTANHRGSISAEHGLGLMKANAIHYSKPVEAVQLMAAFKKLLDINGILNPYKVLPQSVV